MSATGTRLRNRLLLREMWLPFLVWLLVSLCTFGLGWLIVSGHFFKLVINHTDIVAPDGTPVGKLVCTYDVEDSMGNTALWLLASIATLGIALLFYSFAAARAALDATEVEWF